jgi:hypothetical protein
MADAYNLMVCASEGDRSPDAAKRVAESITSRVTDWEAIAANLAVLASEFAGFCDQAMPETSSDGRVYIRPSERIRIAVESRNAD